jgi:ferritin-like metal-binding protein YciE
MRIVDHATAPFVYHSVELFQKSTSTKKINLTKKRSMAKSTSAKKGPRKETGKIPASYARKKSNTTPAPAKDNPSKFEPTAEAKTDQPATDEQDGLNKLFCDSVKDLYWAENQLVKALPKMAKAASSKALQKAITDHLAQTKDQVSRLEQVFALLGKNPQAKKCDAMEGLTKEGEGIIEDTDMATPARNLGIIMASQKVEHYEIAAYTGLIKLAGRLGLEEIAGLLTETLDEEQQSDELLAGIADQL